MQFITDGVLLRHALEADGQTYLNLASAYLIGDIRDRHKSGGTEAVHCLDGNRLGDASDKGSTSCFVGGSRREHDANSYIANQFGVHLRVVNGFLQPQNHSSCQLRRKLHTHLEHLCHKLIAPMSK